VVLVAVQLSVPGLYLPPLLPLVPPQTIISLVVQTTVAVFDRAVGALTVLVAVQLSGPGSYLPPVFNGRLFWSWPPQTIISVPVQTAM
jgi:hypothetical protein